MITSIFEVGFQLSVDVRKKAQEPRDIVTAPQHLGSHAFERPFDGLYKNKQETWFADEPAKERLERSSIRRRCPDVRARERCEEVGETSHEDAAPCFV